MRNPLLFLLAAASCQAAVTLSNPVVVPGSIGHSTATIGFTFAGGWKQNNGDSGNLRIRWTTGATNCSSGTGGTVIMAGYQLGSHLKSGANYFQYIVNNLPAGTLIHVCPEINSSDRGTDWTTGNQVNFTTQSLPAIHPAPPAPSTAVVPSFPDMSAAQVWTVGVTSSPDCSTFMNCWNNAIAQQGANGGHATIIKIPAGTVVTHRNYITQRAADVTVFNGASFTTTGLNLNNSWTEGQGLMFGVGDSTLPGNNGISGPGKCDGMRRGQIYYVHSPNATSFQLTCEAPYSQGGKLLANRTLPGGGTYYMVPYPRALNWIMVTTDASPTLLPPPGVRTSPIYSPRMAKLTQDTNPGISTQDGVASVDAAILKISSYSAGDDMMAGKMWFTGLEIAPPSFCTDTVNGCQGYGQNGRPAGHIVEVAASSDIVFDRNWIHGLPWPNRLLKFISWEGYNSVLINNYMDNIAYGRKMLDKCTGDQTPPGDFYYIDSPNMIRSGDGPGPLVFANNYLEATGIPVHVDAGREDGGVFLWDRTTNILVQRNTFTALRSRIRARGGTCGNGDGTTDSGYPEDPLWEGHAYSQRQPLEFKRGDHIKIDGNVFDHSFRHTSTGTIQMTAVTRSGIHDVDITNNTFSHVYAGVTFLSTGDGDLHTSPVSRLRVQNNLIFDLNGDGLNGWINHEGGLAVPYNRNFGGYFLNGLGHGEDFIIDHNTVTTNATGTTVLAEPGLINVKDQGGEGFSLTNNILDMTNAGGSSYLGVKWASAADKAAGGGICDANTYSGAALFSCYYTGSIVKNNLFLATIGTQSQLTDSGNGWVNGGPSAYPNAAWTGNVVPANPQMNPGYHSITSDSEGRAYSQLNDADLKASSAYISGVNAGQSFGVDYAKLRQARGDVMLISALGTSGTTAVVNFVAPDAQTCPVDVSTDPNVLTGTTRVADTGTTTNRSVSLTGLNAATVYYFRINCAVVQPTGTFRTR